ncbi:MAG: HNH endonuclease [Chitinispirillia bacterium]|nr:HNH endonuclease [Chitinispirillia bacterium]MCL2241049.1 HNH endonuclease [Chitinispirillia bacterium]
MPNDRLCIICNARKPESAFERKGEHIVPRSLGNRKFRTPFVCSDCNNGLGGTVDLALKNVFAVKLACYDRGVGVGRADEILSEGGQPPDNPDVKGAILKIAYEAAHLRLGNNWLDDPKAKAVREILSAYINKDKRAAHALMENITVHDISIGMFYYRMGKARSEHIKHAITAKSCLNALWLAPAAALREAGNERINKVNTSTGQNDGGLMLVFDIEGVAPGYAVVSDSGWGINTPVLLAPALK